MQSSSVAGVNWLKNKMIKTRRRSPTFHGRSFEEKVKASTTASSPFTVKKLTSRGLIYLLFCTFLRFVRCRVHRQKRMMLTIIINHIKKEVALASLILEHTNITYCKTVRRLYVGCTRCNDTTEQSRTRSKCTKVVL